MIQEQFRSREGNAESERWAGLLKMDEMEKTARKPEEIVKDKSNYGFISGWDGVNSQLAVSQLHLSLDPLILCQ